MKTLTDAMLSLCPSAKWTVKNNEELIWQDESVERPTDEAIAAEITRLEAEYAATEYQRLRAAEYPPMSDFADAYYWMQKGKSDLMDVYVARCEAVKQKYPK